MHSPFFTVIVPTRNRAELLPDALKSVLLQDFLDFELIVSDNFNDERTESAISSFRADKRVRVIRTPSVLPMTEHWQFAAEKATGQFILFVTDRSVLKKGALSKIFKAIQECESEVDLCSWTWTLYNDQGGYEYGESLLVDSAAPTQLMLSSDVARGFTKNPGQYAYILPRGLNSCFSRTLFERFVHAHGTPFRPVSPDYFSAFLLLGFTNNMLHIPQPLFVSQGLAISNGGNGYLGTSEKYLATLGDIDWMRHVPIKAPFVDNTIFADFLAAKEKIGGSLATVDLDWPTYYHACFLELVAKKGARVLLPSRLDEFNSAWERALSQENPEVQKSVRKMVNAQPFATQLAYLRYSRPGATLRKLKHWITRFRAGTSNTPTSTVLEVAGFDADSSRQLKVPS